VRLLLLRPDEGMGTGGDGDKAGPALPLEALLALGLDQRTAENALVNAKVTANLAAVIAEVTPRRPLALAALVFSAGAVFLLLAGLVLVVLTCSTWCGIWRCDSGCRLAAQVFDAPCICYMMLESVLPNLVPPSSQLRSLLNCSV
jgi:cytochrome bd-type quinol oxidase subunit 2